MTRHTPYFNSFINFEAFLVALNLESKFCSMVTIPLPTMGIFFRLVMHLKSNSVNFCLTRIKKVTMYYIFIYLFIVSVQFVHFSKAFVDEGSQARVNLMIHCWLKKSVSIVSFSIIFLRKPSTRNVNNIWTVSSKFLEYYEKK